MRRWKLGIAAATAVTGMEKELEIINIWCIIIKSTCLYIPYNESNFQYNYGAKTTPT